MEPGPLTTALIAMGCPPAKAGEMARQLERRAVQLTEERGWTQEQALRHLLGLMSQGWASPQPHRSNPPSSP